MQKLTDNISLYSRQDWDARAAGDMTEQGWNAHEVFIHHTDDTATWLDSLDDQSARMRAYQDFHMKVRGWSDIGYHAVVFPEFTTASGTDIPARIFQGRERNYIPAAQAGHNRGTLAVAVVGADNARMKRNQRYAVEVYLNWLKGEGAPLRTLGGHRDVTSTACPGDGIYEKDLPVIRDATDLKKF